MPHRDIAVRLQQLRIRAGVSLEEAAGALGKSISTVRRIESATTELNRSQITALLVAYNASTEVTEQLMSGLDEALKPGWWHPYREALCSWEQEVLGIESVAMRIRMWNPGLVPDLLRTPAYEAAAARLAGIPDELLGMRLELHAERKRRLARGDCVLWALIPQAALRTVVGSPAVMREQYDALAAAAESQRTAVQIIPLDAPPHTLTNSPPLDLLRVLPAEISDVLVLHGPTADDRATVSNDAADVGRYRSLMDRACMAAPAPRTPLLLPTL